MKCPFCGFEGSRRQVHAHLIAQHRERVALRPEHEEGPGLVVTCPVCAQEVRVPFHGRGKAPELRDEMEGAARMVLFDILLYHVEGGHAPA